MTDAIHAILVLAGAAFSLMVCGGAMAFGVACVCRWMEWSPVNTKVNLYLNGEMVRPSDDVSSPSGGE